MLRSTITEFAGKSFQRESHLYRLSVRKILLHYRLLPFLSPFQVFQPIEVWQWCYKLSANGDGRLRVSRDSRTRQAAGKKWPVTSRTNGWQSSDSSERALVRAVRPSVGAIKQRTMIRKGVKRRSKTSCDGGKILKLLGPRKYAPQSFS